MTHEFEERCSLLVTLLRAAYAALVLGLGAIDAQSVNDGARQQGAVQYNWTAGAAANSLGSECHGGR
jgi:hypothetical protein